MSKDEWTDHYNCYSLHIGDFTAQCNWSSNRSKPGYWVSFGHVRLKEPVADIDKAKQLALQLARKVLSRSLAALDAARSKEAKR